MNLNYPRALLFLSGALFCAIPAFAGAEAPADPHTGHSNVSAGSSAAKSAPPKPEDFIKLDPSVKQTVLLTVIAAYNEANYGMNFNGFAKGNATYTIPKGWKVKVSFLNNSPVPHSAIIVERATVKKLQMGEPYFKGASTPDPVKGTTGKQPLNFEFVADEAGDYALACGFPVHAANGHWIKFEVSETAQAPSLKIGEGDPYVAK